MRARGEGQGVPKASDGGDGGEVCDGGEACDGGKGVGISWLVVSVRPAYMPAWNAADANVVEARASHGVSSSSRKSYEISTKKKGTERHEECSNESN